MSFTQDELQAFNAILDQRLTVQRHAIERSLDQRMNTLRRDFDQHLISFQQNLLHSLPQRLSEWQGKVRDDVSRQLAVQHTGITQALKEEIESIRQAQSQQFEDQIEHALAAQLLAIEQLISQHSPISEFTATYGSEGQPDFESIEVQTEIPWEDLVDVVDQAMDKRLAVLSEAMQTTMQTLEQVFIRQLHNLREELLNAQEHSFSGSAVHMQDIFTGIEQLEQVIESMQVAMNANHVLLSNRLHHHQKLSPERAHPGGRTAVSSKEKQADTTTQVPFFSDIEDEYQE